MRTMESLIIITMMSSILMQGLWFYTVVRNFTDAYLQCCECASIYLIGTKELKGDKVCVCVSKQKCILKPFCYYGLLIIFRQTYRPSVVRRPSEDTDKIVFFTAELQTGPSRSDCEIITFSSIMRQNSAAYRFQVMLKKSVNY